MKKLVILLLTIAILPASAQEQRRLAERYFEQAVSAMKKGNLNEAQLLLGQAIAENPGYVEAYSTRAIVRERLNNTNGALMDYTLSLELLPDQYEVLLARAVLRFQSGHYTLSKEDFTKLLTLPSGETNTIFYRRSAHSPGTDQILTAQGSIQSQLYNYLGLIEVELDNCLMAISHFDEAIQLSNLEADYFVNRALAKLACDHADALNDFNQALKINPEHPIARHNLALAAAKQGSYELAERQLTETIRLDSMMLEPYLERGYYRMLMRNYDGALTDYNRALMLEQSDPDIWLNRGMVREKLNDWKGAYSDYTKAIELKADFTKAWLNRGNSLAAQFRYAEAIEDYSVAITYQPDYAAAYYNRAIASFQSEKKQSACDDLHQAKQLGFMVEEKMMKRMCSGLGGN